MCLKICEIPPILPLSVLMLSGEDLNLHSCVNMQKKRGGNDMVAKLCDHWQTVTSPNNERVIFCRLANTLVIWIEGYGTTSLVLPSSVSQSGYSSAHTYRGHKRTCQELECWMTPFVLPLRGNVQEVQNSLHTEPMLCEVSRTPRSGLSARWVISFVLCFPHKRKENKQSHAKEFCPLWSSCSRSTKRGEIWQFALW